MSTDRRRYGSLAALTRLCVLLALMGVGAALPTAYLQFISDGSLSSLEEGKVPQPLVMSAVDEEEQEPHQLLLVPAGHPIPLKELAATLAAEERPEVPGAHSATKRRPSAEQTAHRGQMLRLARNLPQHAGSEKMYQINNIGDLPMFRFG